MKQPDGAPREGWVLYDGDCGFCSRWVPHWRDTLRRRGFDIARLQDDWVIEALGLPIEAATLDIRLLLRNGGQRTGADVYRHVMRRVWWAAPLYIITVLPLFNRLFDAAYRVFADNRYWISRTCHVPIVKEGQAAGRVTK